MMRRLLIVLGCMALLPISAVTSASAQSQSYICQGRGQHNTWWSDEVVVHDARDNRNHAIMFAINDTPTPLADGCHHVFQAEVYVGTPSAENNGIPAFSPDNGPPFDGATLKLRIWICGTRHPKYDISYVSATSNDAKSPSTREMNYGKCDPQADNYISEAHAKAWTPRQSASSYVRAVGHQP